MKQYVVWHEGGFDYVTASSLKEAWEKAKSQFEGVLRVEEVQSGS